ncbi:MAG TPA: efflux RND transporter permease subunit, partial [Vicinamibacterales bacterium]|nr:efflux RND transporter permease subunit [Vicinamibacterales bacterium]
MSIPRLAIERPVTMFMISAVITLLGVISLTRLPVDLMPEFEQPQLNVRTSYPGVGPLEIEELITRPMVLLHRCGYTAIGIALAQDGVDGTAKDPGVLGSGGLLRIVL